MLQPGHVESTKAYNSTNQLKSQSGTGRARAATNANITYIYIKRTQSDSQADKYMWNNKYQNPISGQLDPFGPVNRTPYNTDNKELKSLNGQRKTNDLTHN